MKKLVDLVKEHSEWMDEHGFRTDTPGARKSLEYWIFAIEDLKKEIVKELITLRDVEKGENSDLMKTRAGYNINLLINNLKDNQNK